MVKRELQVENIPEVKTMSHPFPVAPYMPHKLRLVQPHSSKHPTIT